jgi:hypothetical protein
METANTVGAAEVCTLSNGRRPGNWESSYWKSEQEAGMTKRDEYVAHAKRQLDDWNADMDVLDTKVQEAADGAKEKYRAQLVVLRAKRHEGEKTLAAIKSASEDSWEHLKSETENVLKALKDSVHEFKQHFPAKAV